jgi:hypothetical protein
LSLDFLLGVADNVGSKREDELVSITKDMSDLFYDFLVLLGLTFLSDIADDQVCEVEDEQTYFCEGSGNINISKNYLFYDLNSV